MINISPIADSYFIRNTELYENESIFSYIYRMSLVNRYDKFSDFKAVLNNFIKKNKYSDYSENPEREKTYEILSQAFGFSPSTLWQSSPRRFQSVFNYSRNKNRRLNWWVEINPQKNNRFYFRDPFQIAYCPLCLHEHPHYQLVWDLQCVNICLEHKILLLNSCPNCHNCLNERDIILCLCPYCFHDLGDCNLEKQTVTQNDIDTQIAMVNIVSDGKENSKYKFPVQNNHILYNLFLGFCSAIMYLGEKNNYKDNTFEPKLNKYAAISNPPFHSTIQVNQIVEKKAVNAIMNWPKRFESFLDEYALIDKNREFSTDLGLGEFYTKFVDQKWYKSKYNFFQEAYNSYLFAKQPVLFHGLFNTKRNLPGMIAFNNLKYYDVPNVKNRLTISSKQVEMLVQNGLLRRKESEWGNTRWVYNIEDVNQLEYERSDAYTLNELTDFFETSDKTVLELAKRGYLKLVGGRTIDGGQKWRITRTSFNVFCKKTRESFGLGYVGDKITIGELAKRTANLSVNIVDILELCFQGNLKAVFNSIQQRFTDLMVPANSYELVKTILFRQNKWITIIELAELLKVKQTTIRTWCKSGLFGPKRQFGSSLVFSNNSVDVFREQYLQSAEAASLLDISILTVQKWARNNRLVPVTGKHINGQHEYLFRRSDVEKFVTNNRLTAPKMAKKIGISRSQMCEWIHKGLTKPISGPGIDAMKHYLFIEEG